MHYCPRQRQPAHRAHHARRRLGRKALACRTLRRRRRRPQPARPARPRQYWSRRRAARRRHRIRVQRRSHASDSASLSQLIALTRRIALCIAGDTGPLHLACALGRPVVGIYGPTDPSRNGPTARVSSSCAALRAAATTAAAPSPNPACSPSAPKRFSRLRIRCSQRTIEKR